MTGASGFLGRAAIAAFAESGCALRAAVRQRVEPVFPPNIELVRHPDLADDFDWRPLLEGVDQVIHLAGIAHTGRDVSPDSTTASIGWRRKGLLPQRRRRASSTSYSSPQSGRRVDPQQTTL